MTADACREIKPLLAAAAVGDIDEADAVVLRTHLAECADCRAEQAELRSVAAVLSAVGDEVPSPELEGRVVARVLGEPASRQRWRPLVAAAGLAAAASFVLVGVLTATGRLPGNDPVVPGTLGQSEPIVFTSVPADVAIDGAVVAHTWGTEVVFTVDGLPVGERYSVNVADAQGRRVSAGTFVGPDGITVECRMNAAVLRDDASTVTIRGPGGDVLMRSELPAVEA